MFKMRFKNKKWTKALATVLCVTLAVGAVLGIATFFNRDTKTISPTAFSIGALDPDTGRYVADKTAIYTSEAFSAQGLVVKPGFEVENLTYEIFFYDENDRFINSTGELSDVYSERTLRPVYARIVIYPSQLDEDGNVIEDFKVGVFDVYGIAKNLTITVDAEQDKEFSSNLFETGTEGASAYIELEDYKGLLLHLPCASVTNSTYTVTFYTEKKNAEGVTSYSKVDDITVTMQGYEADEYLWYNVDKIPSGATHATVTYYDSNTNVYVYGICR